MSFATEVVFKVFCELGHGEDVRLGGNIGPLGLYDTNRTVPLYTTSDDVFWWSTMKALELSGDPNSIQYRFGIFSGGIFKRWKTVEFRELLNISGLCVKGVGLTESRFDVPQPPEDENDSSMRRSPLSLQYLEKIKNFQAENQVISSSDTIIILSYFLPVKLFKSHGKWHVDPDDEHIISFPIKFTNCIYAGSIRYNNKTIPREDRALVSRLLKERNCYPIYIEDDQHDLVYRQFLQKHLWLELHKKRNPFVPINFLLQEDSVASLWVAYHAQMQHFCTKAVELFQFTYLVWIHGYELQLLPSMVRRKIPSAKIGYFCHSPFPPTDTWLAIGRQELLKGVLGANQIGFHTYESSSNFLSSCCRILGFNYYTNRYGRLCLNVDGNEVCITSIHKGVDVERLYEICDKSEFVKNVKTWRAKFGKRVVIGGMQPLNDSFVFMHSRNVGFELFLEKNDEQMRHKIVLQLIAIRPEIDTEHTREMAEKGAAWARLVNERYHYDYVHFEVMTEQELRLCTRMAFFAAMDIFVHTTVEHGTLQYPMEYTVATCRKKQLALFRNSPNNSGKNGGIILNAHHPTSAILSGALHLTSRSPHDFCRLLEEALNVSPEDADHRLHQNMAYCAFHTASTWAFAVLEDPKSTVQTEGAPSLAFATSLGSQSFLKDIIGRFRPLDTEELYEAYRATQSRLVLINCDSLPELTEDQRHVLESLSVDKKNIIFLVSSRSKREMDAKYGKFIYLGLAAEHGYYFRWPVHKFSSDKLQLITQSQPAVEWQCTMQHLDLTWQVPTKNVMDVFTKRTIRSYMEVFEHSIVWQYGDADPEFGFAQSKELEEYLIGLLDRNQVDIVRGYHQDRKYIQVRTKGISKAQFMENVVLSLRSINVTTDFVFVAGDDDSDEPLFAKANQLDMPSVCHEKPAIFTTVIGKRKTVAKVCVDGVLELMQILKRLARNAIKDTKFYSTSDLYHLGTTKKAAQKADPDTSSYTRYRKLQKFGSTQQLIHASRIDPESPIVGGSVNNLLAPSASTTTAAITAPHLTFEVHPFALPKQESVHDYLFQLGDQEEEPPSF